MDSLLFLLGKYFLFPKLMDFLITYTCFLVRNMAAPSTTVVLPKWNVDAVVDAIVKYIYAIPLVFVLYSTGLTA